MRWIALAFVVELTACLESGLSRCASGRVCAEGLRCDDARDACVSLILQACGDLVVADDEECDDGNQLSHDGCSSTCRVEQPAWRKLNNGAGVRDRHAMAYDPYRGRIVVFGGVNLNSQTLGDTREWDGTTWTTATPTTSPPARHSAAMAYDPQSRTVLLYGGRLGTTAYQDTWSWDGIDWTLLSSGTPTTTRFYHAMATDTHRQQVVSFGGQVDESVTEPTDLLSGWSGTGWEDLQIAPTGRTKPGLTAYDRGSFLFGGDEFIRSDPDTWHWDGTQWLSLTASGPAMRSAHGMAYEGMGRVVVYGGGAVGVVFDDTWLWDGSRWSLLSIPGIGMRKDHTLAYDAVRRATVLVAGGLFSNKFDDVWTFRYEHANQVDETCVAGEDADGDALAGCADPDCWGVCTPHCPPTSPMQPCDLTLPRCGDGACNAHLETMACPDDCP